MELGSYKSLVSTFLLTDQYMNLFCVFKDALFTIHVDLLALNSQPAARLLKPGPEIYQAHIFLARHLPPACTQEHQTHITSTSCQQTSANASTLTLCSRPCETAKSPTEKHKNHKMRCHIDLKRDTCLPSESWNEEVGLYFIPPQLAMCASGEANFSSLSMPIWISFWVLISGLQIHFSESASSQIWNLNNEDQLYPASHLNVLHSGVYLRFLVR